jgi:hypothetical protein
MSYHDFGNMPFRLHWVRDEIIAERNASGTASAHGLRSRVWQIISLKHWDQ